MIIGICFGLFVAVTISSDGTAQRRMELDDKTGVLSSLMVVQEPDLSGLFQLWDGQWWRLLTTGYHHGNLLHLVFNCFSLAALGLMLEPRMSRLGYFLFFNIAVFVTMLSQAFWEDAVVGISGALCAMFGYLLVLRRYDPEIAVWLSESRVKQVWGILVAMLVLTQLNLLPIASTAHFVGVAYGWIVGMLVLTPEHRTVKKLFLGSLHLGLIPILVILVTHPFWLGRYWWYQSRKENMTVVERIEPLKKAINLDPGLTGAWLMFSELHLVPEVNDPINAWKAALLNLNHNRGEERSWDHVRQLGFQFRKLGPEEHDKLLEEFSLSFGEQAEEWANQIWDQPLAMVLESEPTPTSETEFKKLPPFPLDFGGLPWSVPILPSESDRDSVRPFDPDAPDSALHGISL